MNRTLIDYTPEAETFEAEAFRDESAFESESAGSVFNETDEIELAAEFLEVQSERELDRFLGDLISRAGKAVGSIVRSPIGQALGGVLKNAAKQALPIAGRAIGSYGGSSTGAQAGARAAAAAGRLFGLELEGLSPEDKEFEIAKSFVRFAGEAVRTAVTAQRPAPPVVVAKSAVAQAAARHAPGLLRSAPPALTGRWVRRGRNIVVVNS
jgi:hypothetical protein